MKYLLLFLIYIVCIKLSAQANTDEIDFFVTTENDSSFHIKPVEIAERYDNAVYILNGNAVDESILKTINRKLISRVNASPTDSLLAKNKYDYVFRIDTKNNAIINTLTLEAFTNKYLDVSTELTLYTFNDKIVHGKTSDFVLDIDHISIVEIERLIYPKAITIVHLYSRTYKLGDQEFIFFENR